VDKEYTNIIDRDACLVWLPELEEFDDKLHDMITDHLRHLKLSDIAGLPIRHAPRVLAGFLACRSRQASIVLKRYFRFEVSLLSILCMRMEMGTIRVSDRSDIIT